MGEPIRGPLRMTLILDRATRSAALLRPDHQHNPPVDLEQPDAALYVRDTPYAAATIIARDRWRFALEQEGEMRTSADHIWLADGFTPGRIYEVVYRAQDPVVMGLGFAVTRDFVSFLRHEQVDRAGASNPLTSGGEVPARVIAYGASQSGRFLRQFLQLGFNEDEAGRPVFDGVMAHIAGGGLGSFNHRFAQPTRTRAHANGVYPVEMPPFADAPQHDPHTGRRDGLLDRARSRGVVPRIMYTNTSSEYWMGAASLQHTDPLGREDILVPEEVRIYHLAGAQHAPGPWPAGNAGIAPLIPYPVGRHPASPLVVHTAMRALYSALERWLADGTPPPANAYPRIAAGTLVTREDAAATFPQIPGVRFPREMGTPRSLDLGPRWADGIIEREPPALGAAYGTRVPAVDADGNERSGIRGIELRVPLATYTGWNERHAGTGSSDALLGMMGSYLPFPATADATGDPRPPISARYHDRADFLARVDAAITELTAHGFLLEEDAGWVRHRAEGQWEAHTEERVQG